MGLQRLRHKREMRQTHRRVRLNERRTASTASGGQAWTIRNPDTRYSQFRQTPRIPVFDMSGGRFRDTIAAGTRSLLSEVVIVAERRDGLFLQNEQNLSESKEVCQKGDGDALLRVRDWYIWPSVRL